MSRTVAGGRIALVAVAFALLFGAIGLRLVLLAIPPLDSLGEQTAVASAVQVVPRGDLQDREGRLLATTVPAPKLVADPREVRNPILEAQLLADAVDGLDVAKVEKLLASERHHVVISRRLGQAEVEAVRRLGLPAISFEEQDARVYPNGRLAAHLLGYVGVDNNGLSGAERAFDDRLTGNPPEAVRLSIDLRVQAIVQDEVAAAMARHKAKAGTGLVLDVRTGELLAVVSLPDFDPHLPTEDGDEARKDRNLTQTFELGSVFKLLNVAMGLDSGTLKLDDRLDARNPLQVNGFRISDFRGKGRFLTVPEALMYSSNIANGHVALRAGAAAQQTFLRKIGMDRPVALETGTGAAPQWPQRWPRVRVANVAFGHGIAVTPLHLAVAVGTVMGDGKLVQPTLLRRDAPPPDRPQVVDQATVEAMRHLAWRVVMGGSGRKAQVEGYAIGGKTGTAEKVVNGRYRDGVVLSSFIAAVPIEAPRLVLYVMLDEPVGEGDRPDLYYGGWTAAPTVGRIISQIAPILGLPPSPVDVEDQLRLWGPPGEYRVSQGGDGATG